MLLCLLGVFLTGCGKREEIRSYTVPKEKKAPMPMVSAAGSGSLTYDVPEGWQESEAGGMRKAAFVVNDGEQSVEITVITLPGGAGGLLANVNRWRGQIKLPDTTVEELTKQSQQIDVGDSQGLFVELIGPDTEEKPETILGVILMKADMNWFFKLKGDSALAAREKESFEAFVKSVRFDK